MSIVMSARILIRLSGHWMGSREPSLSIISRSLELENDNSPFAEKSFHDPAVVLEGIRSRLAVAGTRMVLRLFGWGENWRVIWISRFTNLPDEIIVHLFSPLLSPKGDCGAAARPHRQEKHLASSTPSNKQA
jgi:hypothetical protein